MANSAMFGFTAYTGSGNQPRLGRTFFNLEDAYFFLENLSLEGRRHMDRINPKTSRSYTELRIKLADSANSSRSLQWLRKHAQAPKVMRVEDKDPEAEGTRILLQRGDSVEYLYAWLGALGRSGRAELCAKEVRFRTQGDKATKAFIEQADNAAG